MSSDSRNKLTTASGQEVAAVTIEQYLSQHPDFFVGRDELLAQLTIPHESGQAISLLERQVSVLRTQREDVSQQLHEFIGNASENDNLFEKTRITVLALLRANSLQELSAITEGEIKNTFGAVESQLLFITGDLQALPGLNCRAREETGEMLGKLFAKKRTFCGDVNSEQVSFLFPHSLHAIVSAAVVPVHLSPRSTDAAFPAVPVLVIGSDQADYFNNRQDTLFLDFIGEVLAALITRLY